MTTPEEQVQALRKKIEDAKAERARRQAMADQAKAAHRAALDALEEMGHESPEAALAEAKALREKAEETLLEIEKHLDETT